jgi:Right handed beta helix region
MYISGWLTHVPRRRPNRVRILYRITLSSTLLIAMLVLSLPAQAAGSLTRTFVSSAGSDANPCTTASPCATFAAAYAAVAPNGIVAALDPGKYGPIKINGPVTIDGNGWAAITVPSEAAGIGISAGPSDEVILTGLLIDGAGGGTYGISFIGGASLTVRNCAVRNVGTFGLVLNAGGATSQALVVSNSYFVDNGNTGIAIISQSSSAVTASIDRTKSDNNGSNGLLLWSLPGDTGSLSVVATNSVFANNQSGVYVWSTSGSQSITNATLTQSQIVGNGTGITANGANAILSIGQSTIAGNASSFDADGGVIDSYGDNYITDTNNTGSLAPVSKQ